MANQLRTSGVFNLGSLGGGTGAPTRKWGGMQGRPIFAEAASVAPQGILFTTSGTYNITVGQDTANLDTISFYNSKYDLPSGSYNLSALAIGSGGISGNNRSGGGGGGLAYKDLIAVTDGDTLTVVVGDARALGDTRTDGDSSVSWNDGTARTMTAGAGGEGNASAFGGNGGTASGTYDGGGTGGSGGNNNNSNGAGAGGAAGYSGNGGRGEDDNDPVGTRVSAGSGGGGGGGGPGFGGGGGGGGVGVYGEGSNGAAATTTNGPGLGGSGGGNGVSGTVNGNGGNYGGGCGSDAGNTSPFGNAAVRLILGATDRRFSVAAEAVDSSTLTNGLTETVV